MHLCKRSLQQSFTLTLCFSLVFTLLAPVGALAQDNKAQKGEPDSRVRKANYELASRWTAQKVGKLVFDTAVAPHWLARCVLTPRVVEKIAPAVFGRAGEARPQRTFERSAR